MSGRQVDIDFGGGNRFRVEVSELLRMKAGFEKVLDMIDSANDLALETRNNRIPPGEDPYSIEAVNKICERASDAAGCHGAANRAFYREVEKVINMLQATFDQYATNEDRQRASFAQGKD
ncbi:hypothetical protein JOF53_002513 [Crossiella equi]|uniref:PE domain-containing protein n=1 Tax=Crossiella equi TaxID=130796 RepID=A0ABS5AAN0_9PSEU|nr:hypothetical protein [Crossiella equi]MBP2473641.1 hypothetical protein [Crossiella equi]